MMLYTIERTALLSVGRGCGFAAIAIFTVMVGMSAMMPVAFAAGGILSLVCALILISKSWLLGERNYRRTELWLMLEDDDRPHQTIAPQLIINVLREAYLRFATYATACAVGMFAVSLLLRLGGST